MSGLLLLQGEYLHNGCGQQNRSIINTLRPKRNSWYFADRVFKCIELNESTSAQKSLEICSLGSIDYTSAWVQVTAWFTTGNKSLSEPILTIFFNTLRPRQNCCHFTDIFKCIFLNENSLISLKISLKLVPTVRNNNIPSSVQIMAWRRPGDKQLSEPMMVNLLTHIFVT